MLLSLLNTVVVKKWSSGRGGFWWLTPAQAIIATQEAEIRRIEVQIFARFGQIFPGDPISKKPITKKGCVLSSNPSIARKKKKVNICGLVRQNSIFCEIPDL
jgi:hypothetical protein